MELSYIDPLGKRIKYYRTKAGMTQKQLAEACGITESAIRNYELGNRFPSMDTLSDIAAALTISVFSLCDPDLSALGGVLHTLFRIEEAYNLSPVMIDGKLYLKYGSDPIKEPYDYFGQMLLMWSKARELVDNGAWSLEDYHTWQSMYPYTTEKSLNNHLTIELGIATSIMMQILEEKPTPPPKRKHKPKSKSKSKPKKNSSSSGDQS